MEFSDGISVVYYKMAAEVQNGSSANRFWSRFSCISSPVPPFCLNVWLLLRLLLNLIGLIEVEWNLVQLHITCYETASTADNSDVNDRLNWKVYWLWSSKGCSV